MKSFIRKNCIYFFLHILLALSSVSGVFSKLAANAQFLSLRFCLLYGCMIAILGIYAIGWQQIIKRLPLTTAFANRAASTVWGTIWGILIFSETISFMKVVGIVLIVLGIILFSTEKEDADE